MAFTTEQEAQLLQLLTAFKNGKRLNDLPHIGNANPFDLIIEVLDADGETKQSKIATLLPYIEDQCSYGIEWDITVSSPLCTRIGNMALHKTLPVQSGMRGCLLSDAGNVVEYLHPTNWKAHKRDGSSGQVMVEIPAHYRKFTTEGNKRTARISEYPLPGYHFVPKKYVSAYEAVLDRTANKLCSIVNAGTQYRGGANQTDWDGTYRSLLGRPVTVISRTSLRNAARARGAGSQWNCCDYNSYKDVAWLFYIEYANLNCQTAFNGAKDANGYAQGGLGNGVTTMPDWNGFNGYYPFVPCGHSDDLGNFSGEVAYAVPNAQGGTWATVYVPRYRGIENPFGHIWKFTDGINIEVKTDADGGTSKVFVADDPAKFNDSNYNGYTMRGLEARAEGYTKEMIIGTYGEIIPAIVGGGTTIYWCDYHYTNINSSSLRGVLFGGAADTGAYAGFGYASSYYAPSLASASVGSRLCFLPQA